MTANQDLQRRLARYYDTEPPMRAPDWVLQSALSTIESIPQRSGLAALRRYPDLSTYTKLAAAAAVVLAVGGFALWQLGPSGPGGQPTPVPTLPTPTATPTPTPAATPAHVPKDGPMQAGTYFARPLPAPDDGLTVTFTVPEGWYGFGDASIFPEDLPVGRGAAVVAFQFLDATSVNSDPCQWKGPDGDVSAGTTVDELVAALVAQTAYQVSEPIDVSIGGYSGKRVDIVLPAALFAGSGSSAPGCDEGVARLWSTTLHGEVGIYWQAPADTWQANILDVDGTRLVIVVQDSETTTAAGRAEGETIVESMVIEP